MPIARGPLAALRRRPGVSLLTFLALGAAAIGLLVAGLSAGERTSLSPGAIPAREVLEDPRRFAGREVTVTGRVDVLTDRALTLGDGDLIVVATEQRPPDFETSGFGVDDAVFATGRLRVLSAEEVVELLPRQSLLPSQFQGFERQPVVLASSVVPAG